MIKITLITLCKGCKKQIIVKVDTIAKYRKNHYFCADCETGGNTSLMYQQNPDLVITPCSTDVNLDIYDGDGTSNNLNVFKSANTIGGRYISTKERKYNRLKELVKELQVN